MPESNWPARFVHRPGTVSGRSPLAILIQGHGPNGRSGFTTLSERLLASGIATLEYDKHGIGASTGKYEENLPPLTRDTAAWVAAMPVGDRRHADSLGRP